MGQKDIAEKTLEAFPDVFADIVNVLLFSGKQVVKEDELETESPNSAYKADGMLHAQERDIAKYWKKGLVRIAFFGMENQTKPDPDMPLRLMGYDGAAYRAQLLSDQEGKKTRFPVITLVLYFGYDRQWNQPINLYECLNVQEKLKPYVNDYHMNLFEIAFLEDEVVKKFQSDFRIVADYFAQMRKDKDYVAPDATIRHVRELLQLMTVMTGDNRYEEIYSQEMERGQTTMCKVLDKVERRGIEKGIEALILDNIEDGFDRAKIIAKVIKRFDVSEEEAESYYEKYALHPECV